MTDKYIIYRKSTVKGRIDDAFAFVFFCGYSGPDKTICWSVNIKDAVTYEGYEKATEQIPSHRKDEWGIDLHPESRYEQT